VIVARRLEVERVVVMTAVLEAAVRAAGARCEVATARRAAQ
jgi:hypothetical protein